MVGGLEENEFGARLSESLADFNFGKVGVNKIHLLYHIILILHYDV